MHERDWVETKRYSDTVLCRRRSNRNTIQYTKREGERIEHVGLLSTPPKKKNGVFFCGTALTPF